MAAFFHPKEAFLSTLPVRGATAPYEGRVYSKSDFYPRSP